MKTKLIIIAVAVFLSLGINASAQDFTVRLNEADKAYSSGDLESARFSLQQALAELDQVLGREVLNMLPKTMDNVPAIEEDDNVTGNATGFTGMYVNRTYENDEQRVNIELIDDSPLIASLNTILSMPTFMGAGDPNQKRIKIHGYKSLLNRSVDDSTGIESYEIQIPFNKSLLTFKSIGFNDEDKVIKMAETIPLEAIVRMTQ
jgi:hypothetical protein